MKIEYALKLTRNRRDLELISQQRTALIPENVKPLEIPAVVEDFKPSAMPEIEPLDVSGFISEF